jgi:hypothetical protein
MRAQASGVRKEQGRCGVDVRAAEQIGSDLDDARNVSAFCGLSKAVLVVFARKDNEPHGTYSKQLG